MALVQSRDEFATMSAPHFDGFPTFRKAYPPTHLVIKEVSHLDLMTTILSESDSKIIGVIREPVMTVNSWVSAPKEWDSQWVIEEEWFLAEKTSRKSKWILWSKKMD